MYSFAHTNQTQITSISQSRWTVGGCVVFYVWVYILRWDVVNCVRGATRFNVDYRTGTRETCRFSDVDASHFAWGAYAAREPRWRQAGEAFRAVRLYSSLYVVIVVHCPRFIETWMKNVIRLCCSLYSCLFHVAGVPHFRFQTQENYKKYIKIIYMHIAYLVSM